MAQTRFRDMSRSIITPLNRHTNSEIYLGKYTGDPSTFPSSTNLVFVPGFKEHVMPRYPTKDDTAIRESEYESCKVGEIGFHARP